MRVGDDGGCDREIININSHFPFGRKEHENHGVAWPISSLRLPSGHFFLGREELILPKLAGFGDGAPAVLAREALPCFGLESRW